MESIQKEAVSTMNDLIETARDGQEGFRQAAEGVEDPALKALFQQYSEQRAQFVSQLQEAIRRLGAEPAERGSVAGAVHRGWINIKAAVTGKDEGAVIAEAERGEDAAKRSYGGALERNLPAEVRSLVEDQAAEVNEAHDRVRALEQAHSRR